MIHVLKPGFFSTIQDKGRLRYRNIGVPVSGVMDENSADFANVLLGNKKNAAVLEITLSGPELLFESDSFIAISGAIMSPILNDVEIFNDEVYQVSAGSVLKFGRLVRGIRSYLAVLGGFKTKKVLGSRSWYLSVTVKDHLVAGDKLKLEEITEDCVEFKEVGGMDHHFVENVLEVEKGPEFEFLTSKQKAQLLNGIFNIAKENNRMAYQLKQQVYKHTHSILTSSTLPGTVQLTPSGKLIILMKDAQTTGGYPRILQLTEAAISRLSQKSTSEEIVFRLFDET